MNSKKYFICNMYLLFLFIIIRYSYCNRFDKNWPNKFLRKWLDQRLQRYHNEAYSQNCFWDVWCSENQHFAGQELRGRNGSGDGRRHPGAARPPPPTALGQGTPGDDDVTGSGDARYTGSIRDVRHGMFTHWQWTFLDWHS